jgi:hypothetical protein
MIASLSTACRARGELLLTGVVRVRCFATFASRFSDVLRTDRLPIAAGWLRALWTVEHVL